MEISDVCIEFHDQYFYDAASHNDCTWILYVCDQLYHRGYLSDHEIDYVVLFSDRIGTNVDRHAFPWIGAASIYGNHRRICGCDLAKSISPPKGDRG